MFDAVSLHSGGLGGGHYTALVRKGEQYYYCNDSMVSNCSADRVCWNDPKAYILSYSIKQMCNKTTDDEERSSQHATEIVAD